MGTVGFDEKDCNGNEVETRQSEVEGGREGRGKGRSKSAHVHRIQLEGDGSPLPVKVKDDRDVADLLWETMR